MRKTLLFFIVLAMICQHVTAQLTYQKTVGTTNQDEAACTAATKDGGYIIAGTTYTDANPKGSFYILKFSSKGNIQWSKTFGGSIYYNTPSDIIQTKDGGYMVAGRANSNSVGFGFLVKITSTGQREWSKLYSGTTFTGANSIIQTPDGGYAFGGYDQTYSNGSWGFVVRTDTAGNIRWVKKVFARGFYPSVHAIVYTSDHGFALAANNKTSGSINNMFLIKLDSAGAFKWARSIGGGSNDFPYALKQTHDQGLVMLGSTFSYGTAGDIFVAKSDKKGNLLWSKNIGTAVYDNASAITETSDRGLLIAGITDSTPNKKTGLLLVKLDSAGNMVSSTVLQNETGLYPNAGVSMAKTRDSGFVAVGTVQTANGRDYYIAKFTRDGVTCGTQAPVGHADANGAFVTQTVPVTNGESATGIINDTLKPKETAVTNICSAVLPIKLLAFTAEPQGDDNVLAWVSSEEINSSHFEVERSSDAKVFNAIGRVAAAGNTSTPQHYRFIDALPSAGKNFYRLKMVDKDGAIAYSPTRLLENTATITRLYPNPAKDFVQLAISSNNNGTCQFTLVSADGKRVKTQYIPVAGGTTAHKVDISQLSAGIYFAEITVNGKTKRVKLVKAN